MATYEVDYNIADDWAIVDEQKDETVERGADEPDNSAAIAEIEAALSAESNRSNKDSTESAPNETKNDGEKKDEPSGTDERFLQQFEAAFEKRFGVSVDDIIAILGGADELVRQSSVAQQEKELREFWGDDYDTNFPLVVEKFKQLPPELQEKYDNVEGAKLLWAIIQKERGAIASKKTVPQREQVKFLRGGATPATGGASAQWRLSEILEMSPTEYNKNLAEIEAAFRENRVIRDVA